MFRSRDRVRSKFSDKDCRSRVKKILIQEQVLLGKIMVTIYRYR